MKQTDETQYDSINDFIHLIKRFKQFKSKNIPFCAAENVLSPLARIPLDSDMQERYIMGGLFDFSPQDNFIGSSYLHPLYEQIDKHCRILFGTRYADARPLSGINAITTLLMAITQQGDTVMLSMPESGAHPSYPEICKRLGLITVPMPYDYANYNFDMKAISEDCQENQIKTLIFSPSDILFAPQFDKLELPEDVLIIYDATQTLGLIGGKVLPNPLEKSGQIVLLGGTHKTLPGPTNGLIMTNNLNLAKQIDKTINPKFLRNTQLHQIASLLLCLIEFEYFGSDYSKKIVDNSNLLGKKLENKGFRLAKVSDVYSSTHQLFVLSTEEDTDSIFRKSLYYGISLNKKHKKLFQSHGLRLGVQEVTRYNWGNEEFEIFSELFRMIRNGEEQSREINAMIDRLSKKRKIHFTFEEEIVSILTKALK